MTISATAPITINFSMPRSIMRGMPAGAARRPARNCSRPVLCFHVDRGLVVGARLLGAGDLARRRDRRFGRGALLYAVLEDLHSAAQVGADVLQLLGAEDQHDDQQDDQPMPDGK